ncbi:SixA phosphatase family protein [Azospirillum doebereinerae]|uniref:Histidine phosphatase family protein n=1 Tax=Azospirillum doebereinerae TaxID=92933 RepID=A0A433JAY9_9PROT|nr:histidine phosphatase family protein [Azospirillum doebereinerae]MCG5242624.1 histidine phosphatase family protein [Azospirillum doebereinerae]RUQ72976.1 histidine phosphatase family protein [Azospirillum doebereinerae]
MKTLFLLRHAKSAWDSPATGDHDRPLAPRGEKAATLVGRHLAAHHARVDLVLCSTALRAVETRKRVMAAMGPPFPPVEHERGLYLCGARTLLERLRDAPDTATGLMLIAHNPDLHELAEELAGGGHHDDPHRHRHALTEKFPTGACAVLVFQTMHWRDLDLGAGRLADFVQPRKLS